MPIYPHQKERRVRRTGHVTTGKLTLDVAGDTTVGAVAELVGGAHAETLLKTGRLELVGAHVPFRFLYTLVEDR